MQQNPFISFIIPVYQTQDYIYRCLTSCINQTFQDIEIIVVDDCGNDESIPIAKKFADKDSRIKIIHNPKNMGLFHTRIAGEKNANGKYILHLDSDDYIDTSTCKILYKKAHNIPAKKALDFILLSKNIQGGGAMINSPSISIIIPVYNIEKYIHRCLTSCINQTFQDIEIIVVDDCGNDESIPIAKKFADKDSRIKIIHNPKNMGTFHSRIIGSKAACGKYICFLDGDDFLDTKTCEISLKKAGFSKNFEEENLPDMIHFGMQFFPPDWKRKTPTIITKDIKNENILKKMFLEPSTPPWHMCTKIYKRDLINRVNQKLEFIDERLVMAEDALKNFVIALLAKSSCGLKNRFYFYCENTLSITRQINPTFRDKRINDLKKIINILEKLTKDQELCSHPYFYPAKNKIQNILFSVIELEYRFDETKKFFPAYLRACLKSLRYYKKWQTYVRMIAFIISFGEIKI